MRKVVLFGLDPELSDAIRDARRRRGMTLDAVASRIPYTRETVWRLEHGRVLTIDLALVAQLAEILRAPELARIAVRQIQANFPKGAA
ncbi:MAG: helix-turn-helix transcriptional regulator [Thermaerobacter sp.]|nr:helix-turn-helix transcriptional regulator [Thermaerobacter sp.]